MDQPIGLEAAHPGAGGNFLEEVLRGLSLRQKTLPSRFFYDAHGSELFERITELPEYYPTRTEIELLKSASADIRSLVPGGAAVVEFGSGSSRKTGLLLEALESPTAYIPIEISAAALYPAARRIGRAFPSLLVHPVLGGFHEIDNMKLPLRHYFRLGFFPGSTIGNLTHTEAVSFLRAARRLLGGNASFLIGADLQKPVEILLAAYNDSQRVTAAFNLNILARINRELDGTFDLGAFEHRAIYNHREGRIEMHLQSTRALRVSVAGRSFSFEDGETVHTENSHKYTMPGFHELALEGGWKTSKTWVDGNNLFSLHLLV
jgi:dimethylhistidine N-methyltransferase